MGFWSRLFGKSSEPTAAKNSEGTQDSPEAKRVRNDNFDFDEEYSFDEKMRRYPGRPEGGHGNRDHIGRGWK